MKKHAKGEKAYEISSPVYIAQTRNVKAAKYQNEYIIIVSTNLYYKFELDSTSGALAKKIKLTSFFEVKNNDIVCPLNSDKFVFLQEDLFYILDVNSPSLSATAIQIKSVQEKTANTIEIIPTTPELFVVATTENKVPLLKTFDFSGGKEKDTTFTKQKSEMISCVAQKKSPFNILCFVPGMDIRDQNNSKNCIYYSLYGTSLNVIKEGIVSDVSTYFDDNTRTVKIKTTMMTDDVFAICSLRMRSTEEIYDYYCDLGQILDTKFDRKAANRESFVLKGCERFTLYASLLKVTSEKFCIICKDPAKVNTFRFLSLNVVTNAAATLLSKEFDNIEFTFGLEVGVPTLTMLNDNLIGLVFDYGSKGAFEILNGANCADFSITNSVNSEMTLINFSAYAHAMAGPFSSDVEELMIQFTSQSSYVYIFADENRSLVEVSLDKKYPLSTLIYYATQGSAKTSETVRFLVSEDGIASKYCDITFNIHSCHSSCSSCFENSSDNNDTKCKVCALNFYRLVDRVTQCHRKTERLDGYFAYDDWNQFLKCDEKCLHCDGGPKEGDSNCLICDTANGYYPLEDLTTNCSSAPLDGYYLSASVLHKCVTGCKKCFTGTECEICGATYPYFVTDTKQCAKVCSGKYKKYVDNCVENCPAGTKEENGECLIEKDSCETTFEKKIEDLASKSISATLKDGVSTCQATTLSDNKSPQASGGSVINLGECEGILKKAYGIDENEDLLILKADLVRSDQITNQVEYLVFSQSGKKLDLSLCKDVKIEVISSINTNETIDLILEDAKLLEKKGYDMFDPSDPFYTDVCTPFTSKYNTDISLEDRKKYYFKNISFCEENCELNAINYTYNSVSCLCRPKKKMSYDGTKFSIVSITNEFKNVISNSNLKLLKCYELVFNGRNFLVNLGGWIMILIGLGEVAIIVLYCVYGLDPILMVINFLLNQKSKTFTPNPPSKNKEKENEKVAIVIKESISEGESSKSIIKENVSHFSRKKIHSPNVNVLVMVDDKNTKASEISNQVPPSCELKDLSQKNMLSYSTSLGKDFTKSESLKNKPTYLMTSQEEEMLFTDEDYILMDFEEMTHYDNRSFCRIYYCLLKYKQLIIFTFLNNTDNNLKLLKISMFLFTFAMYLTFNEFFYSDDSISRNYHKKGKYDFLYMLPQTIFSSVISIAMNFLLKFLSLSQSDIRRIRETKNQKDAKILSALFVKFLKIKAAIFFTLIMIFVCFFWYFNSAFCAVLKKTQEIYSSVRS